MPGGRKEEKAKRGTARVREVSSRKRIQQTLLESAADLKHAQAVSSTGSWRMNVRRNELSWSDETYRIFGVATGTPLTYEMFLSFVHPGDRHLVDTAWQEALRGTPYNIEHRIVVDGKVKWVREKAELEFDTRGELLGGFGAVQDITERKEAEEHVLRHNRTLDAINTIFKEALDCATEEQLGSTFLRVAADITGSKLGFVGEVGPDGMFHDIAFSDTGLEFCTANYDAGHTSKYREFPINGICRRVLMEGKSVVSNALGADPDAVGTPAGHPPLESFLGVPLIAAGSTVGMIAVANREGGYTKDEVDSLETLAPAIVEALHRKRTEQALIRSEKLVSVGRLAATIAHDINNPLAAALNALYLVKNHDALPDELRYFADIAELELQRAAQIARRTLSFFRESNTRRPVDLVTVASEVIALYRSQAKNKAVEIVTRFRDSVEVVGANFELRQLISNLVANSLDAVGSNGKVQVRISRRSAVNAPYVRFTIADTGMGINARNLQRIFEPFFTTKQDVGTGLGLWIAAQIVKDHGGTIRVRSRVGKGTVFSIKLPAAENATVIARAAAASND